MNGLLAGWFEQALCGVSYREARPQVWGEKKSPNHEWVSPVQALTKGHLGEQEPRDIRAKESFQPNRIRLAEMEEKMLN